MQNDFRNHLCCARITFAIRVGDKVCGCTSWRKVYNRLCIHACTYVWPINSLARFYNTPDMFIVLITLCARNCNARERDSLTCTVSFTSSTFQLYSNVSKVLAYYCWWLFQVAGAIVRLVTARAHVVYKRVCVLCM